LLAEFRSTTKPCHPEAQRGTCFHSFAKRIALRSKIPQYRNRFVVGFVRARLQPCRKASQKPAALAAEASLRSLPFQKMI
jgi:hypothetical protein